MGASERRQKDSNMAAAMKKAGVQRHHANCVICHRLVSLAGLPQHIATNCGRNIDRSERPASRDNERHRARA